MTFLDPNSFTPIMAENTVVPKPVEPNNPGFWRGFGAGFENKNDVWGGLSAILAPSPPENNIDPDFKVMEYLKKNEAEHYFDHFLGIGNERRADAVLSEIRKEEKNRQMEAASGWGGLLGAAVGSLASPLTFIPGVGLIRGAKGGYSVARTALMSAALTGGSVAVQEAALAHEHYLHDWQESAHAIGFGLVLGGLVGGTVGRMYSRAEAKAAEQGYQVLAKMQREGGLSAEISEDALREFSREQLTVAGRVPEAIVNAFSELNPGLRGNTAISVEARKHIQMLSENSVYQNMHAEGLSLGPASETMTQSEIRSRLGAAMVEHGAIYKEMIKAGVNMDEASFNDAIGLAMRNKDFGNNDYVTRAAQSWRKNIFDPIAKDLTDPNVALLKPSDLTPKQAESYFSRVWHTQKLLNKEFRFKEFAEGKYLDIIKAEYARQEEAVNNRIKEIRQQAADMRISGEDRAALMSDLEAGLQHIELEHPQAKKILDQLDSLRGELEWRKRVGDEAGVKKLKDDIEELRRDHNDSISAFQKAQRPLKVRQKNLERGFEGSAEKADKLREALADMEQLQVKSLNRLIQKGRSVERDIAKMGDETQLEAKINEMKETFADINAQLIAAAQRATKAEEDIARLKVEAEQAVSEVTEANKGEPRFQQAKEKADEMRRQWERAQPTVKRLEAANAAQTARAQRLQRLEARLDAAESFDLAEARAEIKQIADALVDEVASVVQRRSARAEAMFEKLQDLDPKKIEALAVQREETARKLEQEFYAKWGPAQAPTNQPRMMAAESPVGPLGPRKVPKVLTPTVDALRVSAKVDFERIARDIVGDAFEKISGRNRAGVEDLMPDYATPISRGPMRGKTFFLEDNDAQNWLIHDVRRVAERYTRQMTADINLVRKFGSNVPDEAIAKVAEDYHGLRRAVDEAKSYEELKEIIGGRVSLTDPVRRAAGESLERTKQRALDAINKDEEGFKRDFTALWNIQRGTYKVGENTSNFGRVVNGANMFNYIRLSGRFAIASLADIYRPAMVYGMMPYMDGVAKFMKGLEGIKLSVAEAKKAGLVTEKILHHRLISMMDAFDIHATDTAAERLLQKGTQLATKFNFMAGMQDALESVSSVLSQDKIISGLMTGKDDRYLAMLGLGKGKLRDFVEHELKTYGKQIDGVWVANTEKWENYEAVLAYRAALSKDVTSAIVRPGQADVPLALRTPLGKAFFQFRSFMMAAHQKVMLRGMQEGPANFVSGMIGATSVGMLAAYLKAIGNGQESFDKFKAKMNPGFLIGEGLDNSGLFTMFFEASNNMEKILRAAGKDYNVIKSPMSQAFGGGREIEGHKTWNQDLVTSLAGPTFGLANQAVRAAGYLAGLQSEESKAGQRALHQMLPLGTSFGLKEGIQYLYNDSALLRR